MHCWALNDEQVIELNMLSFGPLTKNLWLSGQIISFPKILFILFKSTFHSNNSSVVKPLTLSLLMLLLSKALDAKIFENHLYPVMLVFIGYSGFKWFSKNILPYVLGTKVASALEGLKESCWLE